MEKPVTWLASHDAAKALGVTVRTLHRWEAQGRITSIRTAGNHRRYKLADVEALFYSLQPKASA